MADDIDAMLALADEYHQSARMNAEDLRRSVAYENARHAAEVAGKVLLYKAVRKFPARHTIVGMMAAEGVIPASLDPRSLHILIEGHTRGRYGYTDAPSEQEIQEAIETAAVLLGAARSWPDGDYRAPYVDV